MKIYYLLLKEMDMRTQVVMLVDTVCISHRFYIIRKSMILIILCPAMSKL